MLLVGHEPLLGSIIGLVVFGGEDRAVPLRKAQLAQITWTPGELGRLDVLLPAKFLEKLTADS